ncbi:hypothetical protein AAFF_G00272090 [Aldrovandia affinis]|uniref:Uncharacterized protein n=1 Tax=Aldrovandia affinis TaxID=143900 RepID=A0AAD7RAP4_9TELE|nr:hypothetical protein AAFF_G00272090 [Aldrovandia affinis]
MEIRHADKDLQRQSFEHAPACLRASGGSASSGQMDARSRLSAPAAHEAHSSSTAHSSAAATQSCKCLRASGASGCSRLPQLLALACTRLRNAERKSFQHGFQRGEHAMDSMTSR